MHPLISSRELLEQLASGKRLRLIDCRFSLQDPEQGQRAFAAGHIPGALYAHLERDLSGPIVPGASGRHPLPSEAQLVQRFGAWGITPDTGVVAYDEGPGAFAARLWWLLRYLGHRQVQVLDGGLEAFLEAGGKVTDEPSTAEPVAFVGAPEAAMLASLAEVEQRCANATPLLFDARAADRFRGENETIDPKPGHIPGARSLPFAANLADGRFRTTAELRARFLDAVGNETAMKDAIVYCGSGVTACHNLLAAEVAGLPRPRLYAGSYSEWIADGTRPVRTGDE